MNIKLTVIQLNLLYTLLAIVSQTYSLLMVNFSNPTFFIFSAPWIRPNLSARMGDAELFKELGCLLLPNYVEKLNRQEVLFVSLNKTGTNLIIFLQPQREVLYILTSFWGVLHPKDGRNLLFPFFGMFLQDFDPILMINESEMRCFCFFPIQWLTKIDESSFKYVFEVRVRA